MPRTPRHADQAARTERRWGLTSTWPVLFALAVVPTEGVLWALGHGPKAPTFASSTIFLVVLAVVCLLGDIQTHAARVKARSARLDAAGVGFRMERDLIAHEWDRAVASIREANPAMALGLEAKLIAAYDQLHSGNFPVHNELRTRAEDVLEQVFTGSMPVLVPEDADPEHPDYRRSEPGQ